MHRHCRDQPQIIGGIDSANAPDKILHFTGNRQVTCYFIDPCRASVGYRHKRMRKTKLEPLGGKPPKPAGAKDFYMPGRENISEIV